MIVGVMQPYFFPYLGYFSLMASVDKFVIFDDVNYIKKGWVNRNQFLSGGASQRYTLPISKVSQNKKIRDHFIDEPELNKNKFLSFLTNNYKKAPYFQQAIEVLAPALRTKEANLALFLYEILSAIKDYLNLNTSLMLASDLEVSNSIKGQERIVEICHRLSANQYNNAIGGLSLYDGERFSKENISLKFIQFLGRPYVQFSSEFIPNLSIVDAIMFQSADEVREIIDLYEVING